MQQLYMQKYLALDKRTWPAEDKLVAYLVAGEALERQGRLKAAERQYRQALRYARLTQTPAVRVIEVLETLGVNAWRQQRYQESIGLLKQAFDQARGVDSVAWMGSATLERAEIHTGQRAENSADAGAVRCRNQRKNHSDSIEECPNQPDQDPAPAGAACPGPAHSTCRGAHH